MNPKVSANPRVFGSPKITRRARKEDRSLLDGFHLSAKDSELQHKKCDVAHQ